jgi:hypothetical protein
MLTGARRDRVARTMPVTVDHGQQFAVPSRCAPRRSSGCGNRHRTHLAGFRDSRRADRPGRPGDPDARTLTGRRLSRRRIAAALHRAGRRRNLEPATEPIQALRDPGRGPPPGRPDSREACLWRGVSGAVSRLVRCCRVKQEPAGHATAWRKHRTPRTGALTTVDDAPASHLNREGGSTRADRGAGRSWAPGCPPSSETTRAATPTRRPACTTPAGRRSPVPRVRPSPGTCSGPTHARPLLHLRPDRCRRRSSGPSRLQGDRGRGNDRPGRPV